MDSFRGGGGVIEVGEPSAAQQLVGDFAPGARRLHRRALFGDVWQRAELSKRDRSLVTGAALVALGNTDQLVFHLDFERRNGLSPATSSSRPSPTSRST